MLSLALTECVHEFLQLGGALDLEEDLVVVICHLNVKVLGGGRFLVGHDESRVCVVLDDRRSG